MSNLYDLVEDNSGFQFINNAGDEYNVYFVEYYLIDPNHLPDGVKPIYTIGFNCVRQNPNAKQRFDNKTKNTILNIFRSFFENHPEDAFIFICDNSDERERQRRITFGKWFREDNEDDKFERHHSHIVHYGSNWYSSLIISKDCPNKVELIDAYRFTIRQMLEAL
ncbi:DUF6169 family protein [Pedobacter nutrimenti]|uniref:Uncharacterized protein n=1 Tax=Pedobacter nutrimenti TaxID=1241337 RepID=A0A318UKA5_9SPHI|nr:DUF6169 family protein [Pedobacter nutrimenti]PYF68468.1 hypothetical protein B0O44_11255 [Pedobacter nutrimenti]